MTHGNSWWSLDLIKEIGMLDMEQITIADPPSADGLVPPFHV